MHLFLSQIIETACLTVAVFTVSLIPVWKRFIPFLCLICLIEWAGLIMANKGIANHWLYNIAGFIEACYLAYFFYHFYPKASVGKLISFLGLAIFCIAYFIEVCHKGFLTFAIVSNTLLSVWMIFSALGYYYLFLLEEKYVSLLNYAPFWFVTGVFIFYFGAITANFFFTFLLELNFGKFPLRSIIFSVLNLILYFCWIYAFICKRRHPQISP